MVILMVVTQYWIRIYWFLYQVLTYEVKAWSAGAPVSTCRSLYPVHGTKPQKFPSPYFLTSSKHQLFRNESIILTLGGDWFKGFMIMAKPTGNWQLRSQPGIGRFRNNYGLHLLDCYERKDNAVTQSSNQYNDDVEVEWIPPPNFEGRVTFIATVVKTYKKFWTFVHSKPIRVRKG